MSVTDKFMGLTEAEMNDYAKKESKSCKAKRKERMFMDRFYRFIRPKLPDTIHTPVLDCDKNPIIIKRKKGCFYYVNYNGELKCAKLQPVR